MRIKLKTKTSSIKGQSIKTSIPKIISDSWDILVKDKIAWLLNPIDGAFNVYFDKLDNIEIANDNMVYTATAISNGNVLVATVPVVIRDLLGLTAGDYILWTVEPFKDDLRICISKFVE